ncbi:vanillate O-demethylase ferredoxin subunit [Labrenzia sp. EL_208]|nr:vanillate O-demethylase ferredoxin subunit [Labrenzia sp. EL_132]MBG6232999.1 vanillate O-demethylase ferredoxin subunit [Labrenzia sp. EL_208]
MKLFLESREPETDQIDVFRFRSKVDGPLPGYEPGAHIEFDLGPAGTRAYSLIDWPEATDLYTVAVQREDDGKGGSKAMHDLAVGQTVSVTEPKNDFPLEPDAPHSLLLAGGIGITPLISMATRLQSQGRSFALHYSARTSSRMGFADQLKSAFGEASHFYFDDTEPLDLSELMQAQTAGSHVFICGPKGMIDAARTAAAAAGIPGDAVHVELFSTPEVQTGDSAFEIEVHDTGQVVSVAPDQTIIEALEEAGLDVMYDCQRGDCGICQTDVISGTPDHRDVVLSDAEKASGKVMQICVSRAKSARLVLDI